MIANIGYLCQFYFIIITVSFKFSDDFLNDFFI